jgi:phage-related protein
MPRTEAVLFAELDGTCPVLEWLDQQQPKVRAKCIVRIERLVELGHELRRPEADFLRDGIYELRVAYRRAQYRILYFFHAGQAVLAHALVKRGEVPDGDIRRTMARRTFFVQNPRKHTHSEAPLSIDD